MNPINHVVLLMMENRSFDHYLGALNLDPHWQGVEVEGLKGKMALPVNASTGNVPVAPFCIDGLNLDDAVFRDPPHEWPEVFRQYNGGTMNGFVSAYQQFYPERGRANGYPGRDEAKYVMSYYTRQTLPVLYALADQFAVCDAWHASCLGSTWPNRLFAMTGSCGDMLTTGDLRRFTAYKYPQPALRTWKKIPWKAYAARPGQPSMFDLWLGPVYQSANGGTLEDFQRECAAQRLPAVAIVEPDYAAGDDHPPHDPRVGQRLMGWLVQTVLSSPSWADTAIIIVYDEHGGMFDHMQPPTAPEGSTDFRLALLGCRVPAVVVSAYTAPQTVVHDTLDHTSFLKTIAERW
jgi:phospholipase C